MIDPRGFGDCSADLSGPLAAALATGYPYRSVGRRVYKYRARGCTGTIAPAHLEGDASDGAVVWAYVGTAADDRFSPRGNIGIDLNVALT